MTTFKSLHEVWVKKLSNTQRYAPGKITVPLEWVWGEVISIGDCLPQEKIGNLKVGDKVLFNINNPTEVSFYRGEEKEEYLTLHYNQIKAYVPVE